VDANLHLVCPAEDGQMFLLGTDRLGRDVLSRIIYGARISLTIGIIGVVISFVQGIILGGLSGSRGGWVGLFVVTTLYQKYFCIPKLAFGQLG